MRSVWVAVAVVAVFGGAVAAGCGGQEKGRAAEDEAGDGTGAAGQQDGSGEDGKGTESPETPALNRAILDSPHCEGCGDGIPIATPFERCQEVWADKDISFVLVQVPCPELLRSVYLLRDGEVLLPKPFDRSNCEPDLVGFKFEGVDARRASVCVKTTQPIDPGAITLQVKAGQSCEVVAQGEGACCAD